jgi:import inner membrane translocase subunit TIM23
MLPSTAVSFISGLQYFGDHPPNFMGLDPLFLTIAATASCAGLGYLIGPLVGSSLWRLTHRRTMNLIEARDRDFHHHIVRNRVDPTRQSATNPVPDFYGTSLANPLVVKGLSLTLLQVRRSVR